ncbi:MAG: LptF/LptG family permease [Planctomycetota bacterium]|jgi:lipopolysaccharide export LptBFGC system permease protein LptF
MAAGSPGPAGRRWLGRLQRYVAAEFLRALALAAAVFTGFFILMVSLQFEGDARKYGTDVMTLVGALPYFMPYILCFSLPMAFFVASVLAFGRLEGSGEISAMRAAGVRLTTVVAPVLAVALLAALPVLFLVDTGIGWGFRRAREKVVSSGADSILKRAGPGMTFRVDTKDRSYRIHRFGAGPGGARPLAVVEFAEGAPREVLVARDHRLEAEAGAAGGEAERDVLRFRIGGASATGFSWARILRPGEVVLAKSGEFSIATGSASKLQDGFGKKRYMEPLSGNVREEVRFREGLGGLEREELASAVRVTELTLAGGMPDAATRARLDEAVAARDRARVALTDVAADLRSCEMEIHRKLSFAFAPFALALLGIPLGLRFARGGRLAGFGVGVAAISLFYYPLWFTGQGFAKSGALPAGPSVWMVQIVSACAGAIWLSRKL